MAINMGNKIIDLKLKNPCANEPKRPKCFFFFGINQEHNDTKKENSDFSTILESCVKCSYILLKKGKNT